MQNHGLIKQFSTLAAEGQKFRGGRAWFLRARQAWESIKSLAQLPKKLMRGGGGGTPTHFFSRTISGHHLHYWVGVPSVHNTDLRGDKQKKKKKAHLKFRGGHVPPVPPASAAYFSMFVHVLNGTGSIHTPKKWTSEKYSVIPTTLFKKSNVNTTLIDYDFFYPGFLFIKFDYP